MTRKLGSTQQIPLHRYIDRQKLAAGATQQLDIGTIIDRERFLGSAHKSNRPFLEKILDTQMFSVLLQNKYEASEQDDALVFYERCAKLYGYLLDTLSRSHAQRVLETITRSVSTLAEIVKQKSEMLELAFTKVGGVDRDRIDAMFAEMNGSSSPALTRRHSDDVHSETQGVGDRTYLLNLTDMANLDLSNSTASPLVLPGPGTVLPNIFARSCTSQTFMTRQCISAPQ